MNKRLLFLFAGVVLVFTATPGWTKDVPYVGGHQRGFADPDPDSIEEGKPWEEGETVLPDYPEEQNLLEFEVEEGRGQGFRYYVDEKSVSVGEGDGVVRYTLVIRSRQGARNVFHEGMRCGDNRYKTYAFGGGKGAFHPVRKPKWVEMYGNKNSPYREALKKYYFCDLNRHRALRVHEIIASFKRGEKVTEPWVFER